MKQKLLSILALLLMAVTGNAAEKSETISLIGEEDSENETATGTHFKVTCGYCGIDDGGLQINKFGAMTVSALDGTVMTKVTWSYKSLSQNAGTLSATPGTYNGSNTVTGINSTTLTVTSSHAAGVKLSSITIYYEVEDVAVAGITLDKTEASMIVGGETLTLTATVAPDDATDKTVTWTTSDASVATVTNGTVTAVGAGTATITATATNGTADTSDDKAATCAVTVSNPTVTANPGGDGNYWSTYYNATKSFTADENTTVYKAALNGTSSVTLTEVAGREIPAGQAVILKSSAAPITLTPATTTATLSGNDLKGGTTVTDGYVAYTLSRGSDGNGALGFYQYSGGSLDSSKAHLEIPSSSSARSFIGIGDGTTAIELPALAEDEAAEWYSLDGQRLSGKPARKGIYVKNGQKVVIK